MAVLSPSILAAELRPPRGNKSATVLANTEGFLFGIATVVARGIDGLQVRARLDAESDARFARVDRALVVVLLEPERAAELIPMARADLAQGVLLDSQEDRICAALAAIFGEAQTLVHRCIDGIESFFGVKGAGSASAQLAFGRKGRGQP